MFICCLCFLAPPSASDLLHRQPCAGPAGRLSAQLLWQRLGGIRNSKQQVIVWSTHRAPDPAWGPLWENHSRWKHRRDRAPWKWYDDNPLRYVVFPMNMYLNVNDSNRLSLCECGVAGDGDICGRFVCAQLPFYSGNVVAIETLICCVCRWLCEMLLVFKQICACVCVCVLSELELAVSPSSSSAGPLSDILNDPLSQVC